MKDKIILSNNYEIEIESGASLSDVRIRVVNGDGLTVGNYSNLVLVSETSVEKDGKIETSFNLREKTETEKRLDALENGQEVQDGAITDLGAAVSGLAEEGGMT